jgi:hypothetical protein
MAQAWKQDSKALQVRIDFSRVNIEVKVLLTGRTQDYPDFIPLRGFPVLRNIVL